MERHPHTKVISELQERIKKLEDEIRKETKEAEKTLCPKWEYKVYAKIQEKDHWFTKIAVGQEYVIIHRTLINSAEYKSHMRYYGSSPINPPNESDSSVKYFVKNGVLFHDGGGYLMLEDGELCSPGDWEDIKMGKLDKYLRNKYRNK